MGVVGRLAKRTVGLGLAVIVVTLATVLYFSDRNLAVYGDGRGLEAPVDAIIVLGGSIYVTGHLGPSSVRRVKVAVALLREGKTRNVILSGGSGNFDRSIVLAKGMRDYAIGLGAAPDALLIEDRSLSTFENLRFSLAIAESRGFERLAVLTDAYHLERARVLAAYFGRPGIGLVAVDGLEREDLEDRVIGIVREALAWWYNLAKVAGWELLDALGVEPEKRREWIR